MKTVLFDSWWY